MISYSANKPVVGTQSRQDIFMTLKNILMVKSKFCWLRWFFLFKWDFEKCGNSHLRRIDESPPKYKMDLLATIAFVAKISISDIDTCPGSSSDFYFQYKKHNTFNDNRRYSISASKYFTATLMKWEILKGDTGFIFNRWFQFCKSIWRKKPCRTLCFCRTILCLTLFYSPVMVSAFHSCHKFLKDYWSEKVSWN